MTGTGIQPSKAGCSFLFFTFITNIGIYGYQKDESLQCMLPATLRYYGGACGVSRLCSECTHTAVKQHRQVVTVTHVSL